MNKDVIYIEPEDDITDIINRVKQTQKKVVALVPPKKLGVMRSTINMKLLSKVSKSEDKAIVVITTDPALVKIASVSGLPVASNLNSRPTMPSEIIEVAKNTDVMDEESDDKPEKTFPIPDSDKKHKRESDMDLNSVELDNDDVENKKGDKKSKKDGITSKIPNFDKYQKFIIIGVISGVALIAFLIWALVIAPYAKVIVSIKTNTTNFAENVNLVTKSEDANNASGTLAMEQISFVKESTTEFDATGQENQGDKAKGTATIYYTFTGKTSISSITVKAGSVIKTNDLTFTVDENKTLAIGTDCSAIKLLASGCSASADVAVTAGDAGAKYNLSATSGITINSDVSVTSLKTSGGSDKIVSVVLKSDIEKAKGNVQSDTEGKEKLLSQISSDKTIMIESSYSTSVGDVTSDPAEGKTVEDGKKAKLTAKTTYTIYVVNRDAIDEFVKAKLGLGSDQTIYSTGTPFFERYVENDGKYVAKLKTTIKSGPEVTEAMVLEKSKGKKIGEVQTLIKSINGVSDVDVETNFPWVRSVPDDESKIGIEIKVDE